MVEITLKSKVSGRIIKSSYTARQLLETDEIDIVMDLTKCDCQPVGETNVVECNCDEEWENYELVIGEHNHEVKLLRNEVSRLQSEISHLENAWRYSSAQEIYEALPKVIPQIIKGEEWSI